MTAVVRCVLGWLNNWLAIDKGMIADVMKETPRFGAQEWKQHFGVDVEEPGLPPSIQGLLKQRCPFWPEKRISETHLLCLVPKDLTLQKIYEGAQCHLSSSFMEFSQSKNQETYWILITKEIIPATVDQSFDEVKKIVSKQEGYRIPFLREAVIAVIAAQSLKIELFPTKLQFTTSQEVYNGTHPLVGYGSSVPSIYVNNVGDFAGAAGVRC